MGQVVTYDQNIQKVPFKVRDKVLVDVKDYQKSDRKFAAKYYGLFEITKQLSPVTFRLHWPARLSQIHPVFHASKLISYNEPTLLGQKSAMAPLELIDGHEEFEVEDILDS